MEKTQVCEYKANDAKCYARSNKSKQRPIGSWTLIFAVLAAMEPVKEGFAGTRHHVSFSHTEGITIRLYEYAQVPAPTLQRAEDDVVRIFRPAGVDVTFVECPLTEKLESSYPACQGAASPSDFVVNIVTTDMTEHLPTSTDGFGFAATCPPGEVSCVAYIFYERVRQLAPNAKVGPSVVLGRVLSHELGHLLGLVHSESGLMRAEWKRNDFDPDSLPGMVFTPWDCQRIHAEATARAVRSRLANARKSFPSVCPRDRARCRSLIDDCGNTIPV
jgi:hypothetical protein